MGLRGGDATLLPTKCVGGKLPPMTYIRKHKKNGKVYLEEVKSLRINGKVVKKHLNILGKR
jgi:hypothetical protein